MRLKRGKVPSPTLAIANQLPKVLSACAKFLEQPEKHLESSFDELLNTLTHPFSAFCPFLNHNQSEGPLCLGKTRQPELCHSLQREPFGRGAGAPRTCAGSLGAQTRHAAGSRFYTHLLKPLVSVFSELVQY